MSGKPGIAKPKIRSKLRLALGRAYYENKRRLSWYFSDIKFAKKREITALPFIHAQHGTPMLRALSGVDMQLQINKKASLEIAAACIDGIIIEPGEVFSFWRLVGRPTKRRGFKMGLVLRNGKIDQAIGGGLCQMTNMIYWMAIHTELKVIERWRHGFDVFPDAGRNQPFASGATCAYNYLDLQIRNDTSNRFQLRMTTKGDWLYGAFRSDQESETRFEVVERNHLIKQEIWGGYSRHNELWRKLFDRRTNEEIDETFITENHAIMMYSPLLESPQ